MFEKSKHREGGLKHKHFKLKDSGFLDTLITWCMKIVASVKICKCFTEFFIMLKRNCVDVHSRLSFALVKSDNLLAVYWVILEIFWTVSQKAHHWSSWILSILNECNLSRITVRFCILSEVCMINTAPHSTVSPQMWCIKSIKDLLARFCKANLSNAKNSAWSIF